MYIYVSNTERQESNALFQKQQNSGGESDLFNSHIKGMEMRPIWCMVICPISIKGLVLTSFYLI